MQRFATQKCMVRACLNVTTSDSACAGLGTRVGDAVELGAAMNVFHSQDSLMAGTYKASTGHTYTAAGALALIKAVYSAIHSHVPGTIHFAKPLDMLAGRNVHIPSAATLIPKTRNAHLTVHAHSVSGINAHLIVQTGSIALTIEVAKSPVWCHQLNKPTVRELAESNEDSLYSVVWSEVAHVPEREHAHSDANCSILVCDVGGGLGGHDVSNRFPDDDGVFVSSFEDMHLALAVKQRDHVILLHNSDNDNSQAEVSHAVSSALHLIQNSASTTRLPTVWLFANITCCFTCSALFGLATGLHTAFQAVNSVTMCRNTQVSLQQIRDIVSGSTEQHLLHQGDKILVARLDKVQPQNTQPIELVMTAKGSLSSISIGVQTSIGRLTEDMNTVLQKRSVGLNFRDILLVMGLTPELSAAETQSPGADCSGTVLCSKGHKFSIGDEVCGIAHGIGTFGLTSDMLLTFKPRHWSHDEASAAPVAWTTSWLCLEELVPLRCNAAFLVHAATGGVGLMAIQFAQNANACIFATAGRPQKQDFLRSLQVQLISTTRNATKFAAEMVSMQIYRKLDVMLNSLSHESYIPTCMDQLQSGGRFMEIGKRGIWGAHQTALSHPEVKYEVIRGDIKLIRDKRWTAAALSEMSCRGAGDGTRPLPVHTFDLVREATDGFRFLQRASNIGKVVICIPEGHKQAVLSCMSQDSNVLVTEGSSVLRLMVRQWLLEQGVKHLGFVSVNCSRSRAPAENSVDRDVDASVQLLEGSVGRELEASGVVEVSEQQLKGVIHLAGISL